MHRRDLLTLSAAAAVGAMTDARIAAAAPVIRRPIGLQLFTVMKLLEQDFEGTLGKVARLGYQEVETIGAFGRDPAYVRDVLDRLGLRSPSGHLVPGDLYTSFAAYVQDRVPKDRIFAMFRAAFDPARVDQFILEAIGRGKVMGQDIIVWQLGWPEHPVHADIDRFAHAFNRAGKLCSDAGMQFAVHNHDREFIKIGNDIPYDLMVEQTDPALVKLEVDLYWMIKGGGKPLDYFKRFPGRYKLCHLKDRSRTGEITTLGTGVEDIPGLLRAANAAGVAHYFVEYDKPVDPLREIAQSYTLLSGLMAKAKAG